MEMRDWSHRAAGPPAVGTRPKRRATPAFLFLGLKTLVDAKFSFRTASGAFIARRNGPPVPGDPRITNDHRRSVKTSTVPVLRNPARPAASQSALRPSAAGDTHQSYTPGGDLGSRPRQTFGTHGRRSINRCENSSSQPTKLGKVSKRRHPEAFRFRSGHRRIFPTSDRRRKKQPDDFRETRARKLINGEVMES